MKIDVFKTFKLPKKTICGLVHRITSPKGIRTLNETTGLYHYNLHTTLKQIYEGDPAELEDGLYWIVDISKDRENSLHWNHYIMEVCDGEADILESYKSVNGTDWIPKALPTIKQYFDLQSQ